MANNPLRLEDGHSDWTDRADHADRSDCATRAPHAPALPLSKGGLAVEEGQLRISGGGATESIAVAFLAMPCIREHQACLLEERLRSIAGRSGGRLIVAMSEVHDITSAGINALVVVHAHCRQLGGQMAVCGLSRELLRLLKVTHLDRAIAITDDVDEAARVLGAQPRRFWLFRAFAGRRKAA